MYVSFLIIRPSFSALFFGAIKAPALKAGLIWGDV
jgi:hypothetical protein